MNILFVVLAVIVYYVLLPFLIEKINIRKKLITFIPSAQGEKNNLTFQDSVNVCFLFIQALAFAWLIVFYKHKMPLNDNFIHYFYGSLPTFIALGNVTALGIVFTQKGFLRFDYSKSYNVILYYITASSEVLLWSFIAYMLIERKTLESVFIVASMFTVCRGYILTVCTKVPITRDGILLFIPIFVTLLHLFFIQNILASTVIVIGYALLNIISYRTSMNNARAK